uniref:Uncharacterized protein n=1 Tax=Electrophorus electricus TaxID=8005 RepID=A0AAY5EFZ0_ELEEL
MEEVFGSLGRCSCAFWLAVAFDVFGLIILLVGVFADLFFYDFLIYAGAIIIFLSLIWWVFWYTGNISVPPEDLEDDLLYIYIYIVYIVLYSIWYTQHFNYYIMTCQ